MPADDRALADLPPTVARVLASITEAARGAFGERLRAVVLFGSAAEARLRATSDVNVLFVLSRCDQSALDRMREPLRTAHAAIGLAPMFLLEEELVPAAEAFSAKFADILRRHRLLAGQDPFTNIVIPRGAIVRRLQQVCLNLALRLRASYASTSDDEDVLADLVAGAAGPLRSCAASLIELETGEIVAPKEALVRFAAGLGDDGFAEALQRLSEAREKGRLGAGLAGPAILRLIALAEHLRVRAAALA